MNKYWVVMKDDKYLTANGKFTDNPNFAYVYETKEQAQIIADQVHGSVGQLRI